MKGSGVRVSPSASSGERFVDRVVHASKNHTLVFTYTAGTGGISGGAIAVTVPSGWSGPSTSTSAAGYATASAGTVSIQSRTIVVSGLTLAANATVTITYGSKAHGGPGATATSSTGKQTWPASEHSLAGSALVALASSPAITVT